MSNDRKRKNPSPSHSPSHSNRHKSSYPSRKDHSLSRSHNWGKSDPQYDNHHHSSSSSSHLKSKSPIFEDDENIEKPNFSQSGALAKETNSFNGIILKYNEPPESRKPTKQYRLYVFKGKDQVDLFYIHRQSAYLFGSDRNIVDIPIDHKSCSKQHSVIQFRQIIRTELDGTIYKTIKPFIIDLESTNGTFVNGEMIPTSRYFELFPKDVIKFGHSSREYVFLHDQL